jgi:hypothetical protein
MRRLTLDDEDDHGYSRAPELEDLLSLCKALNAERAREVLSGFAGMWAQTFNSVSAD